MIRNPVFLLCDVQTGFKNLTNFPKIQQACSKLSRASQILGIDMFVTEQYPKGLGRTVPEIDISHCKVYEKTRFSMAEQVNIQDRHIVLFGIEAHVCILQTALEMAPYNTVYIVKDATGSDREFEVDIALRVRAINTAHGTGRL
jgi:hypothetical protein